MDYTYDNAIQEFIDLFNVTPSGRNSCYVTGEKPLIGYSVFETLLGADTFIHGIYNEDAEVYYYHTWPGALISVVKDPSTENNGTYRVIPTNNEDPSTCANRYSLVKMLSETDPVGGGSITVEEKDPTTEEKDPTSSSEEPVSPYIYFVGVDSNTTPQNNVSTLYFNHGIVYDANGNMELTTSDTRLKDIKGDLDVDIDSLVNLDKVYFSWKQDESHRQCIGVTAQSVEALFPELVAENPETGYKMVNYAGLSVIALAAIDKLTDKYNDLERRLHELEQKI